MIVRENDFVKEVGYENERERLCDWVNEIVRIGSNKIEEVYVYKNRGVGIFEMFIKFDKTTDIKEINELLIKCDNALGISETEEDYTEGECYLVDSIPWEEYGKEGSVLAWHR